MLEIDKNAKLNYKKVIVNFLLFAFICIIILLIYFYKTNFKTIGDDIRIRVDIENNISLSTFNFKIKSSDYYVFDMDYVLPDTALSTSTQAREILQGKDGIGVVMDFYLKVTNADNGTVVFEEIINSKGIYGHDEYCMSRRLKCLYLNKGNYKVDIRPDKVYKYNMFSVYFAVRYPRKG